MKFILCLVGLVAVNAINLDQMPEDAVELKIGDYYDVDGLESGNQNDVQEDSDHSDDDMDAERAGELIKIATAIAEGMNKAGVNKMDKSQLIAAGRQYLKNNKMKVPEKEFLDVVNEIWENVNTNGDKFISLSELGNALFRLVDQDGDGSLEPNELKELI